MKVLFWVVLGLWLLLSGCGPAAYTYPGGYYYSPYYYQGDPAYDRVPPYWYGNDPSMRQWYTFPYMNPELQ